MKREEKRVKILLTGILTMKKRGSVDFKAIIIRKMRVPCLLRIFVHKVNSTERRSFGV